MFQEVQDRRTVETGVERERGEGNEVGVQDEKDF